MPWTARLGMQPKSDVFAVVGHRRCDHQIDQLDEIARLNLSVVASLSAEPWIWLRGE
jgi:hypothetical protein